MRHIPCAATVGKLVYFFNDQAALLECWRENQMTQHRAGTDFRGNPNNLTDDHMGAALSGYYRRDLEWHFVWLPASGETALYDSKKRSRFYRSLVETFRADINAWCETYETKSDTP